MNRTYIKISKKNATKEEIDKMKKILDESGIKYYVTEEIEK